MIAATLLLFAFQVVTPELRQHVEAGLKAKTAGDLNTAAQEFRRVVELAPELAAAHVNLGAVLFEKKDYAGAIPPLKKAVSLNPDLPGAHGMLGASLLAQGYAADAIPYLEKAQAEDLLGVALLETGREREAVDRLEAALQKRPGDEDLLYYLSQSHARLARSVAEQLRDKGPSSARYDQILGEASAVSGQRDAAEKHFRSALQRRPDLRSIHFALGELYLEAGEYEKAETEFRAEAQLTPGSAAAAFKLGFVLQNQGRSAEALKELQRAAALAPGMPETLLELGKALIAQQRLDDAEKAFRGVIQSEPQGPLAEAAHFQLAQLYRKQGRTADADRETALFQALKKGRK